MGQARERPLFRQFRSYETSDQEGAQGHCARHQPLQLPYVVIVAAGGMYLHSE
jgi:hypothetical protein